MLWRKVVFVILLFLISWPVHAQNDGLAALHNKLTSRLSSGKPVDTSVVNLMNGIAAVYVQHSVPDSALFFAKQAIALSNQLGYVKGKGNAYSNIAKVHYRAGDYDLSLGAILIALRISNEIDDGEDQANAYNVLGLIYLAQDKSSRALAEFTRAAKVNRQLRNYNRLSANYFNISLSYFHDNNLDSSIAYLHKSIAISKEINDLNMIAMANNRLGDIYYKKGLVDKAVPYYLSVLNSNNYQNDWENSFANSGLANCYYTEGNYALAIKHGEKGPFLARKTGGKWDIIRSLKIIQQSYAAAKNYQQAYYYLAQEKLYSDSLFNENKEKELNALHLSQQQTENQVLEKKNQIVQQKNDLHRMVIVIVSLIAFFLVIVVILTYRNTRKKSRLNNILRKKTDNISQQNKLIEKQNDELSQLNITKDQLLSVIGHDLRAPFASMLGTLDMFRSGAFQKEEMDFLFENFFKQVTVTAEMVDNLLLWANSQRNCITAQFSKANLPNIVDQVWAVLDSIALEKKIRLNHLSDERAEAMAYADHIRIILHNIIANALKFTAESGAIDITYKIDDTIVTIGIKDNGIGMTPDKVRQLFNKTGKDISTHGTKNEKGIGIGLMLVKNFVDANHGIISVESKENEGTAFMISFKRYKEEGL